jgi:hypothetical protein
MKPGASYIWALATGSMIDGLQPLVLAAIIAASAALGSAFFAFVAALINASVARKNAILSAQIAQRTKRAEFRQAWIDKLRESLVKAHIGSANPNGLTQEDAEHALRTLLLVNRQDVDYTRLKDCIYKMTIRATLPADEVEKVIKEMLEVSQDLLKREWNVVKAEIDKFDDDARKIKLFG